MKLIEYIKGTRRGREANAIERRAMSDPFLADAIEGYDAVWGNHTDMIAQLEDKITKLAARKRRVRSIPASLPPDPDIMVAGESVSETVAAEQTPDTFVDKKRSETFTVQEVHATPAIKDTPPTVAAKCAQETIIHSHTIGQNVAKANIHADTAARDAAKTNVHIHIDTIDNNAAQTGAADRAPKIVYDKPRQPGRRHVWLMWTAAVAATIAVAGLMWTHREGLEDYAARLIALIRNDEPSVDDPLGEHFPQRPQIIEPMTYTRQVGEPLIQSPPVDATAEDAASSQIAAISEFLRRRRDSSESAADGLRGGDRLARLEKSDVTVVEDMLNIVRNDTKIEMSFADFYEVDIDSDLELEEVREDESALPADNVSELPNYLGLVVNNEFASYFRANRRLYVNSDGERITADVIAEFRVNEKGIPSAIQILTGISVESNHEIINLLINGPRWTPTNGRRIKTLIRYE